MAKEQPIWLTAEDDNPNKAKFLFLVDDAQVQKEELTNFERVFNIFDGNSQNSHELARAFWKNLKNASIDGSYWKQDASGAWKQQ